MSKAIIYIDKTLCKGTEGCKLCTSFCPQDVLGVSGTLTARAVHPAAVVNEENCTVCRLCMLYCPDLAIIVKYNPLTPFTKGEDREEGEENV